MSRFSHSNPDSWQDMALGSHENFYGSIYGGAASPPARRTTMDKAVKLRLLGECNRSLDYYRDKALAHAPSLTGEYGPHEVHRDLALREEYLVRLIEADLAKGE